VDTVQTEPSSAKSPVLTVISQICPDFCARSAANTAEAGQFRRSRKKINRPDKSLEQAKKSDRAGSNVAAYPCLIADGSIRSMMRQLIEIVDRDR
jgi:hypothetical protein